MFGGLTLPTLDVRGVGYYVGDVPTRGIPGPSLNRGKYEDRDTCKTR